MDVVTDGLLSTYQKLLSLKFTEITPANAWHKDVRLFRVADARSGKLVGHFYLDLYPRPNKFTHPASWVIRNGYQRAAGTWRTPATAMGSNFTDPTAKDPQLPGHDRVYSC